MKGRVIVNVGHFPHDIFHPNFGNFKVQSRGTPGKETARYTVCVVPEKLRYAEDKGWGDPGPDTERGRRTITEDGADVAPEMFRYYLRALGHTPDHPFALGLFLTENNPPKEEELVAAEEAYQLCLEKLVDEGNAEYGLSRNVRLIDGKAKVAARVLGINAEWAPSADRMVKVRCPACGDMVQQGIAVHRRSQNGEECNYVFDMEVAKKILGLKIPAQQELPVEKARGRL